MSSHTLAYFLCSIISNVLGISIIPVKVTRLMPSSVGVYLVRHISFCFLPIITPSMALHNRRIIDTLITHSCLFVQRQIGTFHHLASIVLADRNCLADGEQTSHK